jgi:hypothetical protein
MNSELKKSFWLFRNEDRLRYAVDLLCTKYARAKAESLQIHPASRNPETGCYQCLCMLQLSTPKAQERLKLHLNVSQYGNALTFLADVDEKWTGPRT